MSQQLQPQSTETTTALLSLEIEASALSTGIPAQPVLGLPLRRAIAQDLHSVLDYAGGAACVAAALVASSPSAKAVNAVLASASAGTSLLTDYRLSVAKVIPIEVHEVVDYVWGLSNVLSPFVFGYFKKDKVASTVQIAFGLGTIAASLFTDYRAQTGVSWGAKRDGDIHTHDAVAAAFSHATADDLAVVASRAM